MNVLPAESKLRWQLQPGLDAHLDHKAPSPKATGPESKLQPARNYSHRGPPWPQVDTGHASLGAIYRNVILDSSSLGWLPALALSFLVQVEPCQAAPAAPLPMLMFWAWERPEDLRALDPSRAGVACLCQTLVVDAGKVRRIPRRQPLRIPDGCQVVAVTRIEVHAPLSGSSVPGIIEALTGLILASAKGPVAGIQVDFDARTSERVLYRCLLERLRSRLSKGLPLSMTALASWAMGDGWVRGLPVEEIVPMCFRMGADTALVRERLGYRLDFTLPEARKAVGVCLQEPLPWIPGSAARPRRIYVFNLKAWDGPQVRQIQERYAP